MIQRKQREMRAREGGREGGSYLSPILVKKSDRQVTAADLTTAVECRVAKQI